MRAHFADFSCPFYSTYHHHFIFEIKCYFNSLPTLSAYSSQGDPYFTSLVMCGQQKTTDFSMSLRTWKIRLGIELLQGSFLAGASAQGSPGPTV